MAVNTCLPPYAADLDEINSEVEAAQWTDDPDALRCAVAALAETATRLAELLANAEDERRWYRDHPWRTVIADVRGLLALPFRSWRQS